jgi:predicted tellurium resistance membrane protein TerC
MEIFAHSETWIALLTLIFLQIVLGIDNIIFISIAASKLSDKIRKKAINIGMVIAMFLRILLLFAISSLTALKEPFYTIDKSWIHIGVSGQAVILFIGGLFLLYKSVNEIHEKIEGVEDELEDKDDITKPKTASFSAAIIQISLINVVFSFDSILTAIGMTNGIKGAFLIMTIAIVISVIIMILFANPVSNFVSKHPTIQMLGLSFLILIGFMLIAEAAHISHAEIFGKKVGEIPKGYLYFTIMFSLILEFMNMKVRKNSK